MTSSSASDPETIKVYMLSEVALGSQKVRRKKGDRRNPNSLRFVVAHILSFFYETRAHAAKHFAHEKSRYKDSSGKAKTLTESSIGEFLRDESFLQYWQLECIAKAIGVPTGSILIFSRLYALLQRGEYGNADELVRSMSSFARWLEEMNTHKTLSKADLDKMVECFGKLSRLDDALL